MKPYKLKLINPSHFNEYYDRIPHTFHVYLKRLANYKVFSVKDFEFYHVASAVYSSKIEGSSLDINGFYRNRGKSKQAFKPKEVDELEDLVSAYKFASENKPTEKNFLRAHKILSKHLVARFHMGKYRKGVMGIYGSEGLVYQAVEWNLVPDLMKNLFNDIGYLLTLSLSEEQIFYYASMIHLWLVKIHPMADGNGRSARLLEKWFLASALGKRSWSIMSEKYYWDNRPEYYRNVALGFDYYHLNWSKSIPFLLMLPYSLKPSEV